MDFQRLLSAALLLLIIQLVVSQDPKITTVLDQADKNVKEIATQAVVNAGKVCESLAQCTQENCARRPCQPRGKSEIESLTCVPVDYNPDCNSCSNSSSLLISTNESYLRLASSASESNTELKMSMCAQKPLRNLLQTIWQNSNKDYQGWVFFGSAEGFLYTIPGRDYTDTRCLEYDPRLRPWYINALAVVKSLYIVMDTSGSMSNPVGSFSTQSCLDVAREITLQVLNTLTNEDRVAVSNLNGDLFQSPVSVLLDGISTSKDQAEINTLQESIRKLKVQDGKSEFKAGLTKALGFFGSTSDLKVLLILSDGQFTNSLNLSDFTTVLKQLRDENVVIFFYKVGNDASSNTANANMLQLQSLVNMTVEAVKDADNPLFKIRSYFDYLAWLRFENVNKTPFWVPLFNDSSGFGDVTTSTFPAFDSNRRLIGVAGIDIIANRFIKELGLSAVEEAVSQRSHRSSHQRSFEPPQIQQASNTTVVCPQSEPPAPFCVTKKLTTPIQEFICCGICSKTSRNQAGKIVGISIGGFVVALVLAAISFWIYKKCLRRGANKILPPPPTDQDIWIIPPNPPK